MCWFYWWCLLCCDVIIVKLLISWVEIFRCRNTWWDASVASYSSIEKRFCDLKLICCQCIQDQLSGVCLAGSWCHLELVIQCNEIQFFSAGLDGTCHYLGLKCQQSKIQFFSMGLTEPCNHLALFSQSVIDHFSGARLSESWYQTMIISLQEGWKHFAISWREFPLFF